eukprot:TRINITY_DN40851_c0_g1_i1.p1 TRINITY_DN40851_c0_g1~~TRINITY_DN40851_c0_g1_i1.p1  ORF type:complete len:292 (-),score=34.34 TRINITY_DN40851_c0_g1_i1:563-1438(-)
MEKNNATVKPGNENTDSVNKKEESKNAGKDQTKGKEAKAVAKKDSKPVPWWVALTVGFIVVVAVICGQLGSQPHPSHLTVGGGCTKLSGDNLLTVLKSAMPEHPEALSVLLRDTLLQRTFSRKQATSIHLIAPPSERTTVKNVVQAIIQTLCGGQAEKCALRIPGNTLNDKAGTTARLAKVGHEHNCPVVVFDDVKPEHSTDKHMLFKQLFDSDPKPIMEDEHVVHPEQMTFIVTTTNSVSNAISAFKESGGKAPKAVAKAVAGGAFNDAKDMWPDRVNHVFSKHVPVFRQ